MTVLRIFKTFCAYMMAIVTLMNSTAFAVEFAGGTGEPNNPYQIATAEQLISIGSDSNLLNKHFVLVADIDLDPNLAVGQVFTQAVIAPSVKEESYPNVHGFNGSFNGNGHRIKNLTIHGGKEGSLGLFGILTGGGRVYNLGLEKTSIIAANGSRHIGALVGLIDSGTVYKCYATGTVSGGDNTKDLGGLVGSFMQGVLTNCYTYTNVRCVNNSIRLGGLVGSASLLVRITNCYTTGNISGGDSTSVLGGMVGSNGSTISKCYTISSVVGGQGASDLGGLVGQNWGNISNCYFLTPSEGGGPDNDVGSSLAEKQMKQQASFVGWDFESVWTISDGKDYPRLRPGSPEPPEPQKPSPPDLSRCTRVEIQLLPSTLTFFCPVCGNPYLHNLMSPSEKDYLKSLQTIVLDDHERIKAFANDVGRLSYLRPVVGRIREADRMHFVCYRNGEHLTSFTLIAIFIRTEDGHYFRSRGFPSIAEFISQIQKQIKPFELRAECAQNLYNLGDWLDAGDSHGEPYPQPSEWCDVIVKRIDRAYGSNKEEVQSLFVCPGAGDGKWHYAMNPNCRQDSPPDTVLLFETKGGWNQHGGPELFTFDNHDPRGGCVLLNDGTVNFIRTQEELQQLRWK